MSMTWKIAFLQQAYSDYKLFLHLQQDAAPFCHQLHYLQMTTEKLAKGYLAYDNNRPEQIHNVFLKFMRSIRGNPELSRLYGCSPRQFREFIDSLLPLAKQLEEVAPAGGKDKPNAEYPWELDNSIYVPATYNFPGLSFTGVQMIKMLKSIELYFRLLEDDMKYLND